MKPVGYLTLNKRSELEGERGAGYDYVMAIDGLHVLAHKRWGDLRVRVSKHHIRGLGSFEAGESAGGVDFTYGKPDAVFFGRILDFFQKTPNEERYACIVMDGASDYKVLYPKQSGRAGSVEYERPANTVIDVHSHGSLRAFFSSTDNRDDDGAARVSIVVGRLDDRVPQLRIRLGVYGCYLDWMSWDEVFSGIPSREVDVLKGPSVGERRILEFAAESLAEEEEALAEEVAGFRVPLLDRIFRHPSYCKYHNRLAAECRYLHR